MTPRTEPAIRRRLPSAPVPPITWQAWQVVDRAKGFHVAREADSGAVEFLRNEVHGVKVFRKRGPAEAACAQANFTATAQRLSAEPLFRGGAAS